jgi:hypothetical protein
LENTIFYFISNKNMEESKSESNSQINLNIEEAKFEEGNDKEGSNADWEDQDEGGGNMEPCVDKLTKEQLTEFR